jgi:hypothetical protein
VYRFEGLKPLSLILPRLEPPQPPPGLQALFFGGREAAAAAAVSARRALLRAFSRRLLGALSYSHARGVAHCCLGSGSVQCSGFDERAPDKVIVKLDNWGLARLYPGPLQEQADDAGASAAGAGAAGAAGAQRQGRAGPVPRCCFVGRRHARPQGRCYYSNVSFIL